MLATIRLRLQLNHPKGGCITPLGRLSQALYGSPGEDTGHARVNDDDIGDGHRTHSPAIPSSGCPISAWRSTSGLRGSAGG